MLININKIFEDAFIERNIATLEHILSSSDNRVDLIEEFSKSNNLSTLATIIPRFRSKGLIVDVQETCNMLIDRGFKFKKGNKGFKPFKLKCIHFGNVETNKVKYLKEDTFEKNKLNTKNKYLT